MNISFKGIAVILAAIAALCVIALVSMSNMSNKNSVEEMASIETSGNEAPEPEAMVIEEPIMEPVIEEALILEPEPREVVKEKAKSSNDPDIKKTMNLYYATNRSHVSKDLEASTPIEDWFGINRTQSLNWGRALVTIPRDHKMGTMESRNFVQKALGLKPNKKKHVILAGLDIQPKEEIINRLKEGLGKAEDKSILVFVHGYNTSFQKAARRAGQLTYDLGFNGPSMFFSWPSQNSTKAYTVDETMVKKSIPAMHRFLKKVTSQDADRVVIIAHSMGTRLLSHGLDKLIEKNPELAAKVTSVVLAAPDIDKDVFTEQLAPQFKNLSFKGTDQDGTEIDVPRVTVYASDGDTALKASKAVHGDIRLGDATGGIAPIDGVNMINASGLTSDFFGHTYFGDNSSIISDMIKLINGDANPRKRGDILTMSEGPIFAFSQKFLDEMVTEQ